MGSGRSGNSVIEVDSADDLVGAIRVGLMARADPSRAPKMRAYMKSVMPYLGVPVPDVRAVVSAALRRFPPSGPESLARSATTLWRGACHREERYAATALTRARMVVGDLDLLPLCQEMIVTGAWWDHVDEVSHCIGDLLLAHPQAMRPVILRWSSDPDRWLRRSAIICQLRHGRSTDPDLLVAVITPNLSDLEFFIRKAIGWALRDYASSEPEWVRRFVADRRDLLSPLSVREALKHIG
ncbi:3-methyladenine DNA glycosylase AlkD [Nakamurella sp. UYEF19]|uniref:DNA alkylation repair protein n=1 Tax=Nakamurella sp. UYEF19 TaxID=1756392 RepID=UPI003398B276